jgi:tetratricopeptide (TPR) repeat protein
MYVDRGEFRRAEPLYREALEIWETAGDPARSDLAASLNGLASLCSKQNRFNEALPLSERAVSIAEASLGPHHPTYALLLNNLASIHISLSQFDRAEWLLKQALETARNTFGEDHPETATILTNYAVVLKHTERKRQARELRAQARDILTRHVERNLLQHSVDASQLLRESK